MAFGKDYWRRTKECAPEELMGLEAVLSALAAKGDARVVWVHRYTDDAGALRVPLRRLVEEHESLCQHFGPDLLFADEELALGLCFGASEDGVRLRWWLQ
ncbi:MAG: hypothetical protein OXR73_01445 [Myxococcales bacterium]|nr:hypothetical protein [Myxococcales bacterium]